MQKRNLNKNILQLLKSHSHMDKPPKNTPVEHPPPVAPLQNTLLQENTSGELLLYVKRIWKNLNYKKLLFTVVKRNVSTIKNK